MRSRERVCGAVGVEEDCRVEVCKERGTKEQSRQSPLPRVLEINRKTVDGRKN
jgi:hypothetical protein